MRGTLIWIVCRRNELRLNAARRPWAALLPGRNDHVALLDLDGHTVVPTELDIRRDPAADAARLATEPEQTRYCVCSPANIVGELLSPIMTRFQLPGTLTLPPDVTHPYLR